jgi:hypothetical protein
LPNANVAPDLAPLGSALEPRRVLSSDPGDAATRALPAAPEARSLLRPAPSANEARPNPAISARETRVSDAPTAPHHTSAAPPRSTAIAASESEIELLKQARSALSADPLRAVALTERCAREFPRGTFAQERDFIAISALTRLGRSREASARAAAFRASYPRSAYLPQLRRMLGEE